MAALILRKAKEEDLTTIHGAQIESFQEILGKYQDFQTNPGAESLAQIRSRYNQPNSDYYLVSVDGIFVGAIRIVTNESNTVARISPMFIRPEYQGLGYGRQTINEIEKLYQSITKWELDTIREEDSPMYFYENLGYRRTGKVEAIRSGMTIAFFEKVISEENPD